MLPGPSDPLTSAARGETDGEASEITTCDRTLSVVGQRQYTKVCVARSERCTLVATDKEQQNLRRTTMKETR
jgi:hypothetical protein